jgi:hypothetical protein
LRGRISDGLLLRALWWRRGSTAALFLVATIAVTAAALGPLYARAAAQSALTDRLTAAPNDVTGLRLETTGRLVSRDYLASLAPRVGQLPAYPTAQTGERLLTQISAPGASDPIEGYVAHRDGFCAHLTVVSGICPERAGQVIVSQRMLEAGWPWGIGTTLTLPDELARAPVGQLPTKPPTLTVVGTYRPTNTTESFWFGVDYFTAHPASFGKTAFADAIFCAESEWGALDAGTQVTFSFDRILDPSRVRLADVTGLRNEIGNLMVVYNGSADIGSEGSPLQLSTGMVGALDATEEERHTIDDEVLLVSLQLVVLALVVLFHVMANVAESRGNDLALAKLRGQNIRQILRFGLGEPVAVLLAAIPCGIGLAWLVVYALARSTLARGVGVEITAPTVAVALLPFAAGLIAAGLATRRTLARPMLEQWRRSGTIAASSARTALLLDLGAGLAAVALCGWFYATRGAEGDARPTSLLIPGLAAIGVALLGARLLPLAARRLIAPTRASRRIGSFLLVRAVARRTQALRLAAVVAVSVALASFAIAAAGVARSNQEPRARAELGAPTVLTVQYAAGHDPVAAAAEADPTGRWAAAVAQYTPGNGAPITAPIVGVDPTRFARVAFPVAGSDLNAIATKLDPPAHPVVTIRGTRARLTLRTSALVSQHPIMVVLEVDSPAQRYLQTASQRLAAGNRDYDITMPAACAAGCAVRGIAFVSPPTLVAPSATIVVTGIAGGPPGRLVPVGASLTAPGAWRDGTFSATASAALTAGPAGLEVAFHTTKEGGVAIASVADTPAVLPVVATENIADQGRQSTSFTLADTAGPRTEFSVVSRSARVPGLAAGGVVADLADLRSRLPSLVGEAHWTVWLGPDAPGDAGARLERAGLLVEDRATVAGRVAELGRQGPALALRLQLFTALAASLLALGAVCLVLTASNRRRATEFAALRLLGTPPRTLFGACLSEMAVLVGAAVVFGVPTGWICARLVMPQVPIFADPSLLPIDYQPGLAGVLIFGAAFSAIVIVVAAAASHWVVRSALPSRLRESST